MTLAAALNTYEAYIGHSPTTRPLLQSPQWLALRAAILAENECLRELRAKLQATLPGRGLVAV